MTTDLEKRFFDTFGIEPKKYCKRCCWCRIEETSFGDYNRCLKPKNGHCNCSYPQITDRILLELIRIIGKKPFGYLQCENTYSTNLGDTKDLILVEADDLKEGLLTLAIQKKVVLRIKHQVQALFEEGEQ